MGKLLCAVSAIVVGSIGLYLWGRIGWFLACRITDSEFWRWVIAVPLIAVFVWFGMSLTIKLLGKNDSPPLRR